MGWIFLQIKVLDSHVSACLSGRAMIQDTHNCQILCNEGHCSSNDFTAVNGRSFMLKFDYCRNFSQKGILS